MTRGSAPCSLSRWVVGRKGVVSRVHTHNRTALQKLIAMGVLPKTEIELVQKFPSIVFRIQNTAFSIDQELADQIFIEPLLTES